MKRKYPLNIDVYHKVVDTLIDAKKAIENVDEEHFGYGQIGCRNGDWLDDEYPLKFELIENIKEVLKEAGCVDEL